MGMSICSSYIFAGGGVAAGVSCITRFEVSKFITCIQKCLLGTGIPNRLIYLCDSNIFSVDSGMELHVSFHDVRISTVLYPHIFITTYLYINKTCKVYPKMSVGNMCSYSSN